MRLIDGNKLLETYKKWIPQLLSKEDEGDRRGVETCIMVLEDAPTVDAVPVVDFMIAHGVTVQECKLGDKIYQTDGVRIYESIIGEITLTAKHTIFVTENIAFDERAIGNSVFLSYAEAEAHLLQQPAEENKNGV